jgi:hypothetical protein
MRKELSKSNGERKKFSAIFSRIGSKKNYKGYSEPTVLLTSVTDLETNQKVADHLWFSLTKGFEENGIKEGKEGSVIEFEARVKEYEKGYVNRALGMNKRSVDYKLSHPTKIIIKFKD